jgi:DNA-binding response OmpR family regulator
VKLILIIEDDCGIAELERDYLEANGFAVEIAADGKQGLQMALQKEYALILLDVMLPGQDGFGVCRQVRAQKNTPILMVSARREDIDKIRALGIGADDYIVKPFSPNELVARVKAHIARYERLTSEVQDNGRVLHCAGLEIQLDARRVFVDGREAMLANREFELLAFLAENPGIVFSREKIFDRVWGMEANGDTATVMVHINRIREKIELDPAQPHFIETVWGAGYRFYKA